MYKFKKTKITGYEYLDLMQIKWYALTYVVFIYILFIQKWKLLELTLRTLRMQN